MVNLMTQLEVRLFGAPEILCAGVPLDLQQHKARALVFYLAATGRAHARDHLATLFWGESDSASARHSLRSTLYSIRQALRAHSAGELLAIDGGLVSLQQNAVRCDVLRYCELLAEGTESTLAQAVALYRGPLLQGFTLRDSPEFDRWQRETAEDLYNICRDALKHLVNWATDRHAASEVVRYLQQLAHLDPLDEATQRRLISLYLEEGSLAKAMHQFEALEAELHQELGVSPEPETSALIREAMRQRRPSPQSSHRSDSLAELSFGGRDEVLDRLRTLANGVALGHGTTVLIQGDDGIGKTRLVTEIADDLAYSASWHILRGTCSPFDDLLEFAPFFEAFQVKATHGAVPSDLSGLFGVSGEHLGDVHRGLFLRVLRAIRFLARDEPLVLVLEDLHWASSTTLRLFGYLAMRLHELPALLIGTTQRAEAIPALSRLLVLGRRHGEAHLITLDPLTPEAIADILRSSHVASLSLPSLAVWLHDRSGGNPYLLGELLAQLRREDILTMKAGEWHVDSGRWLRWRATAAFPETAHDLVTGRLSDLSVEARYLLDVLAVAGEPLPYDLLRALHDGASEHALEIMEELQDRHLVKENTDDSFELPHHLLREALLHHLGRLRRRAIHRQLASMIEICPALQRQIPLRQVARHAVAGGDVDRARQYGIQVVESLQSNANGPLGVEFLRDLYELLAPTSVPEERFLLTRALGKAYRETGNLDEASRWLRQALDSARDAGDSVAQTDACFEQAELALVANDYETAVAAAEMGLAVRGAMKSPSQESVGRGHWLVGAALAMNGIDLMQAERHLKKALEAYRHEKNPVGQCSALFEMGNVAAQHGQLEQALASYAEAAHEAELAGDQYFLSLAHNNYAYHSLLLGRLDAAQQAVAKGRRIAERAAIPAALLHLCSTEGEVALYVGDWEAAEGAFQSGLRLAEELGSLERQAGCRAGLGLAARGTDDVERALMLFRDALALLDGRGYWHLQARVRLWLADALLAREHIEEARLVLDAALAMAQTHRRELLYLHGERLHARLLAAEGNWTEANAIFARLVEQTRHWFQLEGARTKASWGECAMRYGPSSARSNGSARLTEARDMLAGYGALAEVSTLDRALMT